MPGTPQPKPSPLLICQKCPKEVKPGEDLCWDCLGEKQEEPGGWIPGSGIFFGPNTGYTIPLSINGLDVEKEIRSLQAQVTVISKKLDQYTKTSIWQKIKNLLA